MPETKPNNVYARIARVQQGIHTVIKSGTNTFHNYKFARERDVIAEIKPLLQKEGLAVTHSVESEAETERLNDQNKKSYMTKLTIRFRITNIDEPTDFTESVAIGYGHDSLDKGAPKAYAMALKYFLSKQFLVETGDDTEEERGNRATGKPASKATPPKADPIAQTESPDVLFRKAKVMIAATRNIDGLLEYREQLLAGKTFGDAQKKELAEKVMARVNELADSELSKQENKNGQKAS